MGVQNSRDLLAAVHGQAIEDLLELVSGFYSNIEDGLFELAHRSGESAQQERAFNLMRELRFRRTVLINNFTGALASCDKYWWSENGWQLDESELEPSVSASIAVLCDKANNHFGPVLRLIRERRDGALSLDSPGELLPISPRAICIGFVQSCRALKMDQPSLDLVLNLFGRFVLDRLGGLYARCNETLKRSGWVSRAEFEAEAAALGLATVPA
ncbi:MAG: DUF1631 family protein [Pseudomonadota bacterium]